MNKNKIGIAVISFFVFMLCVVFCECLKAEPENQQPLKELIDQAVPDEPGFQDHNDDQKIMNKIMFLLAGLIVLDKGPELLFSLGAAIFSKK